MEQNEVFLKLKNLKLSDFTAMQQQAGRINTLLEKAVRTGEAPTGQLGRQIAQLHKEWVCASQINYTPSAHRALADSYVAEERFLQYYDKQVPGCAAFLHDAVLAWLEEK